VSFSQRASAEAGRPASTRTAPRPPCSIPIHRCGRRGGKKTERALWHSWGHYGKKPRGLGRLRRCCRLFLASPIFEPVASILRFWAKGDGKRLRGPRPFNAARSMTTRSRSRLFTAAWREMDADRAKNVGLQAAPTGGKKCRVPFTRRHRPWRLRRDRSSTTNEDFELWVDDVELVKAP